MARPAGPRIGGKHALYQRLVPRGPRLGDSQVCSGPGEGLGLYESAGAARYGNSRDTRAAPRGNLVGPSPTQPDIEPNPGGFHLGRSGTIVVFSKPGGMPCT